jgi:hypothetical protein
MKTYKFEIIQTEEMLEGDEYWEDVLEKDPTGITPILTDIIDSLDDKFGLTVTGQNPKSIVKLIDYKDN